ncbi:hemin ABC transporter substrate-binding protein [Salipiger profundus]|uniref:Iron complex transport system substrate-binding protein n=2 Tax=Roseobacteraceae TaxID=2854170 RepID=A0A1U7D283_9RHOB|nr:MULTISPECIES: ABC transporter substrate-binding protein [Salipiger]APX22259.1 iron complex transport system substrate-binding protein [Salipiger profundus]GGA30129.1 hemin ABC transporter substrate-binding protein [Salipiger profundus]SFD92590.1 iron complex transport system substrate-binding protein [Salipiger profundus]
MISRFTRRALATALMAFPLGLAGALNAEPAQRIVSIGGAVTEIVYALGEQDRLVARDTTSTFPPEVTELPDIGYIRQLSPEGVLSVDPTLILTAEGAGPPEAVALLKQASIDFAEIPEGFDRAAVLTKIHRVAEVLDVPEKGEALAEEVSADLDRAQQAAADATDGPPRRVLFILSLQGGRIMAGGRETAADGIIRLSGGENSVTGFEGYKPLSDEAVIAAAPDVILLMAREGELAVTDEALFSHPAILSTPAGENRSVIRMDGMKLLGFGPRTAEAATDLARALAGD